MKLQFLGTAAAEGIPAIFCTCENCRKSWQAGGRNFRTRSQALVNDELLLDFPPDTYAHFLANRVSIEQVKNCLITHSHQDHLYELDIAMSKKGFAHMPEDYTLRFYGTKAVGEKILPFIEEQNASEAFVSFQTIKPFENLRISGYTVTPLPSIHDPKSGPVFYQISDGDKTLLYAHDTHFFQDSVWDFWAQHKPHFDLVSLDCTNACLPLTYVGHMGLPENAQVRSRMLEMGIADESTVFICNHYSHNGTHVVYDDFLPIAGKEGFLISYDGMKITL